MHQEQAKSFAEHTCDYFCFCFTQLIQYVIFSLPRVLLYKTSVAATG